MPSIQAARLQGGGTLRRQAKLQAFQYVWAASAIGVAVFGCTRDAHAQAGYGEVHVGIGPTFGAAPSYISSPRGPGAQASAFYGINSTWSVGTVVGMARLFGDDADGAQAGYRFGAFVGPSFNIDVLEIIPYVSLAPGILLAPGDNDVTPALRGAVGLDWRPRRQWAVGIQFEWHAALPQVLDYPTQSVIWLRFSWIVETMRW
jgi:hypothetical protein